MYIRLASKLQRNSIVDGEGIRAVVWTQGCPHNCYMCHNPETHDFNSGFLMDVEELKEEINSLDSEVGITFSGGDPFVQPEACLEIAKYCHDIGLNVWCYTGYTYERLLKIGEENSKVIEFLNEIDILIDGPFIYKQRSLETKFRGSKNQRVIDVKKSLENNGKIVLLKDNNDKNIDKKKEVYI